MKHGESPEQRGWVRSVFAVGDVTDEVRHDIYRKGSGPAVIVIHELPAITPRVIDFGDDVVAAGFTVVMPSLVGSPGQLMSQRAAAAAVAKVCVSREFTHWALQHTSPVIGWLRTLAASLHAECGGPGVGAVGMCFSGGFALAMMVDDVMVAPVVSQPSMPFAVGRRRGADLNVSADDAARIAARAAAGCQVLALRYRGDPLVGGRFESLKALLGEALIVVELDPPNRRAHSVLTEHRDEPSVRQVIGFLGDKLGR